MNAGTVLDQSQPQPDHRPRLEIIQNQTLGEANFMLVNARIEWSDGSSSEGWGRHGDLVGAQARAVGEAVERYAYTHLPSTAFSVEATNLDSFIHPELLVRYEDQQYARQGFPFARFDAQQTKWWLPAHTATDGEATNVLADCVCNPRAFDPQYRSQLVTYASSSGCASGSQVGGAVLRATLELLERDAFMRHWFSQTPGTRILLESLPTWARLRFSALAAKGCIVGLQCLTLGSHPVWLAWAQHPMLSFTSIGTACALEAEAALLTALNELETMALARVEGLPEPQIVPEDVRSPMDHAALYATPGFFRNADAVLQGEAGPFVRFTDVAPTFVETDQALYVRLRMEGHPIHWVDLSAAEAATILGGQPIHTVRVVAPGLIPMAFGYGHQPLGMDSWGQEKGQSVHPFC